MTRAPPGAGGHLEELQQTLKYIYARVVKWLGRRGLLRDADASNEAPSYSAGEALTLAGMQRGILETALESGEPTEPDLSGAPPRVRDAAVHERFNLHASVHLGADDDLGRERLCRYLARPAFSLARFGLRRDGLVVYRVKKAGRGRVKQRVMTPLECLGRLAAMVPPPRYPLLRLHGVLGPRHTWRARVVPRPPQSHARCTKSASKKAEAGGTEGARSESATFGEQGAAVVSRGELLSPSAPRDTGEAALVPRADVLATSTLLEAGEATQVAPNILSVTHWNRILDGELYAPLSRVDWATLLRSTFDVDVKSCTACGGRMTVRAVVTDQTSIAKLLRALRRPRAPPVAA